VHRQTYGYLPSLRASPPFDRYQVILLGDRASDPVDNFSQIFRIIIFQFFSVNLVMLLYFKYVSCCIQQLKYCSYCTDITWKYGLNNNWL